MQVGNYFLQTNCQIESCERLKNKNNIGKYVINRITLTITYDNYQASMVALIPLVTMISNETFLTDPGIARE